MEVQNVRNKAIDKLRRAEVEEARTCVDWLIEHVTGLTAVEVLADPSKRMSEDQEKAMADGLARRLAGEPLQYIVGWTEFYGLRLSVSRDVLIPRPETEIVVETVLELSGDQPSSRILDVGTGSGCIALAVASLRQSATIVACDVSADALAVAESNAMRLGLSVRFVQADVENRESVAALGPAFDIIASNPPYIPTQELGTLPGTVRCYEPAVALSAGDDPLRYYRALIDRAKERLAVGGHLVTELHADYAQSVMALASAEGMLDVDVKRDLAGLPRVLVAAWGGS